MKILNWIKSNSVGLFIVLFAMTLILIDCNRNKYESIEVIEKEIVVSKDTTIIKDYVYNTLCKYKVNAANIVLSQAIIESSHFNSKLFKENNNLFGMKHPSRRPTTSLYSHNGYAYYESIDDCIVDYLLWQLWGNKYNMTDEEYLNDGLSGYAEDPNYKNLNLKISNKLKTHGSSERIK